MQRILIDYNVFAERYAGLSGLQPAPCTGRSHPGQTQSRKGPIQAVFKQLGLTPVSDEQVEAVTYAHGSKDTLPRDVTADLMSAEDVLKRGITGVDVVKALAESGYRDLAESVLNMLKQRVAGDYMQTAAILDRDFHVLSGVNTPNDYMGPGTGYRVEGKRWREIQKDSSYYQSAGYIGGKSMQMNEDLVKQITDAVLAEIKQQKGRRACTGCRALYGRTRKNQ